MNLIKTTFNEKCKLETEEWFNSMKSIGNCLKQLSVKKIYFIHGTFAGEDALGVIGILEPFLTKRIGGILINEKLKSLVKHSKDLLYQDMANFIQSYQDLCNDGFEKQFKSELFIWSSGNYHLARLLAALKLINSIAKDIKEQIVKPNERILFLNHSHAGQLCCIITQLLENKEQAKELFEIIKEIENYNLSDIKKDLELIKKIKLDFVTLGTPIRYKWGICDNYRLMAIVNNRNPININGIFSNRDGDYIQHYGITGSDLLPPPGIIKLNDKLDSILDQGRNPSEVLKALKNKNIKTPLNTNNESIALNIFIDYQDNFPNPILFDSLLPMPLLALKSKFGHGIYTSKKTMLFNFKIILEHFYKV